MADKYVNATGLRAVIDWIIGKLSGKSDTGHTHNYAGASTAGGSATSAVKLDTSAGNATTPVYFSGGKPVSCSYSLQKSVPSDAVFTDTNTWRGIQNNLTSDSTTDSLSAAQGKALKELVDGKAASSHKHTKSDITDMPTSLPANGGNADTVDGEHASAFATSNHKQAYTAVECVEYDADESTMGVTPAAVKKAITKVFEPKSHTHNYAGSSSAGGSATSAVKLDSSAGSATQPVYFSGGKPVSCSYSLQKSVPSDAVFTDTNTWRGIQNNLTSDSTTDSLAAAQGKALKALVDGKAASSHKHTKSDITDMPTSLPANGGNADTVDGKHASDIFAHKGLATCGQVSPNTRGCFNVNLTDTSMGWLNAVQFEQAHFITQLGFSVGEPCSVFVRTRYAANSFTDWNTGWTNLGTNIVIGTSRGTIAYKSGYTKALIEFWKTTVGSASRTVYDSALITGLSSSMTAVTPSAISSGQDFAFALGNDASGGIIISGNFTKYKITYFN